MADPPGGSESPPPKPPDKKIMNNTISENKSNNSEKFDFTINNYCYLDLPPFIVIVESNGNEDESEKNLGNLHPMALGRILKNNEITGIETITRKGKNRLGIEFNKFNLANEFINNNIIKSNKWKVTIPVSLVTVKGIVKGIDKNISMEEIIQETETQRTILSARRLNRKFKTDTGIDYIPSETVVITFKGKILPQYIKLHYCRRKIEVYISPVMQCKNCWRFGHLIKQCRSKIRCPKCSEEHEGKDCTELKPECIFCKKDHMAYDKNCPEFKRQKNIKEYMVFENKSYYEARQKFPKKTEYTEEDSSSFNRKGQDFPTLRSQQRQKQEIDINQRREYTQTRKRRQDYSTITQSTPKKSTITQQRIYSQEHMDCLYPPPCRSPTKSIDSINRSEGKNEETITALEFFENMLNQLNLTQEVHSTLMEGAKSLQYQQISNFRNSQYNSPQNSHIVRPQIHNPITTYYESMEEELY